jgi:hypothetical protein
VYRRLGGTTRGTVRAGDYNFFHGKVNENHQMRTGCFVMVQKTVFMTNQSRIPTILLSTILIFCYEASL